MKRILSYITFCAVILSSLCACEKSASKSDADRNVMILISLGYNSLSSYLTRDINTLAEDGYVPKNATGENVLLVFGKHTKSGGNYTTKTEPVLIRLYTQGKEVVRDTIKRWDSSTIGASAETINEALTYIKSNFEAKGYGIVLSSHGTGWLPEGYYSKNSTSSSESQIFSEGTPSILSITQEFENGTDTSYEIEIEDFVDAIPMHLDYLLLDACLMGGVEMAYAAKDKADVIGFSQAEVLAQGFIYENIAKRLIGTSTPDPEGVCSDYFEYYNALSGDSKSATISLVDCSKMNALASVCKTLFEKYRQQILDVDPDTVQGFFRYMGGEYKHWFYDLADILDKSGASDEDMATLNSAIENAIIYKNATESFLGKDITINTFCGLSMYLPAVGNDDLNSFYKTLSWNKATELVK